jgi:asparagine synthase (glutamine-hydrolysing)
MKRLIHRGPDATGLKHFQIDEKLHHFLGHQRLSIVDPYNGDQPLYGQDKNICCVANGEIYNHMELRDVLKGEHTYIGRSDCLIIPHLYEEMEIKELCNTLSGKFGAVIYDKNKEKFYVIRDHLGIIPVYIGRGQGGEFWVASELKAIHDVCTSIEILLPGHYYDSTEKKQIRWYNPLYQNLDYIPDTPVDFEKLRNLLIQSVKRRLMTDVPFGVLLSGGLDSSLIASITSRLYEDFVKNHAYQDVVVSTKLHSFCIGLENSPDLIASRKVADFLGTFHHEFTFTLEQGIDAISEVIYCTETFNPTTIRASTPMWLMARRIKSYGIKVVLTGEGSDEVFGGYLYFHKAPNKKEFHQETIRKLMDLYKYDLLRANKSTASWGIEGRVPFLDKDFVEYCMSFDPSYKMINEEHQNIEKWVLRKAFDDKTHPYLPDDILWRQKEQFSDGVGYNWIDGLKAFIETQVSDDDLKYADQRFPIMTPPTKEAYYYRMIYEQHFPSMSAVCTVPQNKSIACSTEKAVEWDEAFKKNADESGRAVIGVHKS